MRTSHASDPMPAFNVRYFDPVLSRVVQEQAEAASTEALQSRLGAAGLTVLAIRASQGPRLSIRLPTEEAFDVAWWCRELATLIKAGMTVVEAIETLDVQSRGSKRAAVHSQLLRLLREGQALSKAMRQTGAFPAVLVASVAASERTSTLSSSLDDFLRYDEMIQRLKRQALSAAIYPALVVSLGILISLFLLLYVIPRFSRMYADFHGSISLPTQMIIEASRVLHEHTSLVIGGLVAAAIACAWAGQQPIVRRAVMRIIESVPLLRRQWDHFRRAKLYQSLALMFKGGYTLDEALVVCEGMGLGATVDAAVHRARSEIARGRGVAAAFSTAGFADSVAERLLAVGERGGGFDKVLQTIADRHASEFAIFVERATRIVEPVLLMIVALVVGGIVVMMYMPIFDIANGAR